jgi:engulfment and cell motility protein 1
VINSVASRVKIALRRESSRPWHEVEADFLECEYRAVRGRQMKELEEEDDLLNKMPVRSVILCRFRCNRSLIVVSRNLRAKLYKESYEFVRQQRIQCLLQGAWFINAVPLSSSAAKDTARRPRLWRFLRLVCGFAPLSNSLCSFLASHPPGQWSKASALRRQPREVPDSEWA